MTCLDKQDDVACSYKRMFINTYCEVFSTGSGVEGKGK